MGFREERKNLSLKGFSLFPTFKYFQHYSSYESVGLDLTVVLIKYLNRSFWQNFIFVAILCFGIVVYSEFVFKTEDFFEGCTLKLRS